MIPPAFVIYRFEFSYHALKTRPCHRLSTSSVLWMNDERKG
jgi:hypothetical protein